MAETQLKLAEAEKNIYWLMFVRSPGRGGSVCRHSWISDLPASVSFSLCVCVYLYLHLSLSYHCCIYLSSLIMLTSFPFSTKGLGKGGNASMAHGFCFVLFCFVLLLRIPEEKGGSPSLLTFGTHKIISKTQVEHMPPLNQSLWLGFK